jgi:hypothetical protein
LELPRAIHVDCLQIKAAGVILCTKFSRASEQNRVLTICWIWLEKRIWLHPKQKMSPKMSNANGDNPRISMEEFVINRRRQIYVNADLEIDT